MDDTEEITLELEENVIICKKKLLYEHSDYFKVMFQGNFKERCQTSIQIKEVDHKAVNIILTLLTDETYILEDEDLLLVLQAAYMLQFVAISSKCIDRLTQIMCLENCLKIWHVTESLDIKPLYLKAKNLALIEFNIIKDTDCLMDLNLKQLHAYLSNVFLCPIKELDVFATCMKWHYESSLRESFKYEFSDTVLFSVFLNCIDFHSLSESDIKEMMMYPDVVTNMDITNILSVINRVKSGGTINRTVNPIVNQLLNGKRRLKNNYPCMLLDSKCFNYGKNSRLRDPEEQVCSNKPRSQKNVMLYDAATSTFTRLMGISEDKLDNLEGFHILGYKELIFLFGGEFHWGRGTWSDNFWVYDIIVEKWERKTMMPFRRRHFESCIANNIVYIIGGTGGFRILQDNMFWYNYKLNEWSNLINLPCLGRQIKCCEYRNQLFLLNVNNKCGYLFNFDNSSWTTLTISDDKRFVRNFPEKFVVFWYEDFIYIKGSSIIKLKIVDNTLEIIDFTYLAPVNVDTMESVLCNGILYTIYKRISDVTNSVIFDKFDVSTYESEVIAEYDMGDSTNITLSAELSTKSTKLFNLAHYAVVEKSTFLTELPV